MSPLKKKIHTTPLFSCCPPSSNDAEFISIALSVYSKKTVLFNHHNQGGIKTWIHLLLTSSFSLYVHVYSYIFSPLHTKQQVSGTDNGDEHVMGWQVFSAQNIFPFFNGKEKEKREKER